MASGISSEGDHRDTRAIAELSQIVSWPRTPVAISTPPRSSSRRLHITRQPSPARQRLLGRRRLILRTSPYVVLAQLERRQSLAIEVDEVDQASCGTWSVVVHGRTGGLKQSPRPLDLWRRNVTRDVFGRHPADFIAIDPVTITWVVHPRLDEKGQPMQEITKDLCWASREAELHGARLTALTAWQGPTVPLTPMFGVPPWGYYVDIDSAQHARSILTMLERVVAEAGATANCMVVEGAPANVLTDHSAEADLLVVGSRGQSGFAEMLLGSVSQHIATPANCPVVIVR